MPSWYEESAQVLLKLAVEDKELFREVLKTINLIKSNPLMGDLTKGGNRYYRNESVRVCYNFSEKAKEPIVILSISIHTQDLPKR